MKALLLSTFLSTVALQASTPQSSSSLKDEQKSLQAPLDDFNKMSLQFNENKNKDKSEQLISNLEILMGRKMSLLEKEFLKAEFSQNNSMPFVELKENKIVFYDSSDDQKEPILKMEIVDAEKNIFKYNNIIFELNSSKPIHETLKMVINGLNTASN